jgi:hypothetical protein
MKFLYGKRLLPLASLWRFAHLNSVGRTRIRTPAVGNFGAEASKRPTNSTESYHEQASCRYFRFGHCFFDARFGSPRTRIPPRFRDIPDVSTNPEHQPVLPTGQDSQSQDTTDPVNDPAQDSQSQHSTGQVNDPAYVTGGGGKSAY